jgi:hypothetical protein
MNVTNSGVTPEAGITYSNLFVFFSRDEEKGPHGEILAIGQNSIMIDMNSFVWVSKKEMGLLGGAVFSASATLPIVNNSLTSDLSGAISGGGGFADSYYQPITLGWRKQRVAVRAIYGFLAPTGRFSAGANTNVGSGYWTSVVAGGQTIYLDSSKATALSAFQMYEFHSTQEGTIVRDKLKGKDFFDVKQNPLITFRSNKVVQTGSATFDVQGTFTIRGVSKPETLTLTISGKGTGSGEIKGTIGVRP